MRVDLKKRNDKTEWLRIENSTEGNGCLVSSAYAELGGRFDVTATSYIDIKSNVFGRTTLTAIGCIDAESWKFEPEVYWDPLQVGWSVEVNFKDKELFKKEKSWWLFEDRIKIYPRDSE